MKKKVIARNAAAGILIAVSLLFTGCQAKDVAIDILKKSYTVVVELRKATALVEGVVNNPSIPINNEVKDKVDPYLKQTVVSCNLIEQAMQYIAKVLGVQLVAEEPVTAGGPVVKVAGVERLGVANKNLEESLKSLK